MAVPTRVTAVSAALSSAESPSDGASSLSASSFAPRAAASAFALRAASPRSCAARSCDTRPRSALHSAGRLREEPVSTALTNAAPRSKTSIIRT
eukprot:2119434-Prymnesium_polylepis.1